MNQSYAQLRKVTFKNAPPQYDPEMFEQVMEFFPYYAIGVDICQWPKVVAIYYDDLSPDDIARADFEGFEV